MQVTFGIFGAPLAGRGTAHGQDTAATRSS